MRIRNMVSILAAIIMLVSFGYDANAQGTLTVGLKQSYFGADGAMFADKLVTQDDLNWAFSNGCFGDAWVSTGFDKKPEFDKELDLIGGCSVTLKKLKYATDFEAFIVQGVNVINWNHELGFGPVFVRFEAYAPMKEGGPRKGFLTSAGARHEFTVTKRLSLNVQEWVKHDTGAFGFAELWLAQGYAGLSVGLNDATTLHGGIKWSTPIVDVPKADGREGKAVWEIGISRTFGK